MKKVLILSDGRAGHFNQSLAVAEAMKTLEETENIYLEVKVRKVSKYILRFLLNSKMGQQLFRAAPSAKMINIFYKQYDWEGRPDIIISSGKDTSLLNVMLSLMYGSKNIFIGNPKKLNHHLFTKIMTVLDLGFDNQIVLDVAPTSSYKGDLSSFIHKYKLDKKVQYYTLLVGGDGAGYTFEDEEIRNIISFVNRIDQVQWLVSTSRRTAKLYEGKMKKEMKTACFIDFNINPEKVVSGFLELSTAVFVTEESASMLSESIASKKSVFTLVPKQYKPEKNYKSIIQKFVKEKSIERVEILALKTFEIHLNTLSEKKISSLEEIALKLGKIL